jgi:GAF domain/PilZ domain
VSNSPAGRVPSPDGLDNTSLSSSSERRKHARTKVIAGTKVVLDANSNPATVVDLSEGGVGVRSDAPLEQGATCRVQLAMPDSSQVIDAACELAWKQAPHAGFRFTILTEKSQRQIKEWLKAAEGSNGNGAVPRSDAPMQSEAAPDQLPELFSASDEALLNLAIKARDFTHADGIAVAMQDSEGIICRASLGFAPDMGVRIQSDRGLSGECLRTGEIVVCYDSQNDPRVDAAVARDLNMRSAVIVPIGRHESPVGLLEVFFDNPRAFNEATVYALQELVSSFFLSSEKPPEPEPAPVAPPVTLPKMASFSMREAAPGFVICDVCGLENNDNNRVCDRCDVPLPAALSYVDLNSPESNEKSGLRREGAAIKEATGGGGSYRKKLLFMLLVGVMVAAWQARGKISADTHIPSPPSNATRVEAEAPKPQLQDKPVDKPLTVTATRAQAAKPRERAEPEVTVRTFSPLTKRPHSKPPNTKTAAASNTTPTTIVVQQADAGEAEHAGIAEQPIVLPLDDQEVVSAVSAPPPAPTKAKQPSVWKRIGKKMILRGGKAEQGKK